jgi:large subunit ribosomal protein L29
MIAQELRELPDDELRQKLADGKEELFNLRFQVVTGQLDNPRRLREVRRDIARVLTVMKEREIAAELAPVGATEAVEESDEA